MYRLMQSVDIAPAGAINSQLNRLVRNSDEQDRGPEP
jgi:hypothetical protein